MKYVYTFTTTLVHNPRRGYGQHKVRYVALNDLDAMKMWCVNPTVQGWSMEEVLSVTITHEPIEGSA